MCGTGQEYGSKSGFVMVAISVSCLAKEEEKIPRHHPHHINQPREHNGEDLTEGNQGARFSTRSFLLPSISLTLPVCRPVSGVDPKRKKKKSLCPPIVGCTAHYLSLSLSFSFCSYEGLSSHFPRGDHLSTHLTNRTHFLRVLKLYVHPAQPGCSLSLFYSTTDRKTIDECTSDVTPDPRGTERDLKRRISTLSLKKKNTQKRQRCTKRKVAYDAHLHASFYILLIIFLQLTN